MRKKWRKHIPIRWMVAALLLSVLHGTAWADVARMTTDELKALLDDPDIVIVDVRSGYDWKSSEFKIKGAVRQNPSEYENWASKLNKEKTVVLYCA